MISAIIVKNDWLACKKNKITEKKRFLVSSSVILELIHLTIHKGEELGEAAERICTADFGLRLWNRSVGCRPGIQGLQAHV